MYESTLSDGRCCLKHITKYTRLQNVNNDISATEDGAMFSFRIFQHFEDACGKIESTLVENTMRQNIPRLAYTTPYLSHMALAFAATHLARFTPDGSQQKQYALVALSHWDIALEQFQSVLAGPLHLSLDSKDSEAAMTLLTTAFTFSLDDEARSPLAAAFGFRAVGALYEGQWTDSVWIPVMQAADDEHGTFTNQDTGVSGLMLPTFIRLCELDETSSAENNPYHTIVRALSPLFILEEDSRYYHFGPLNAFGGRTWTAFRPLLERKDERALLLLAYWLVLLGRHGQWWLATRPRTQCAAIVSYLSKIADPDVHDLLLLPATFGADGSLDLLLG